MPVSYSLLTANFIFFWSSFAWTAINRQTCAILMGVMQPRL
jgi:hypothetical protein